MRRLDIGPRCLVMVLRMAPVSSFLTIMPAPETTAPDGSLTVPERVAET